MKVLGEDKGSFISKATELLSLSSHSDVAAISKTETPVNPRNRHKHLFRKHCDHHVYVCGAISPQAIASHIPPADFPIEHEK